jgi:hypothetical protein
MSRLQNILDDLTATLRKLFGGRTGQSTGSEEAWTFITRVMRKYHFTDGAQSWIRQNVNLRIDDLNSTRGGGYWIPSQKRVHLFTAQDEAAVHELAHSWWHYRRHGREEEMIESVVRLSADKDPRFAQSARLAFGYVHGIPEQNWAGMLVERNDWEMFAGLASGTMGDMSKLPPYVRKLYDGLFEMPSG